MGCVIIRQAIRREKRRYNLRPALCYVIFWRRLFERGRLYERFT